MSNDPAWAILYEMKIIAKFKGGLYSNDGELEFSYEGINCITPFISTPWFTTTSFYAYDGSTFEFDTLS